MPHPGQPPKTKTIQVENPNEDLQFISFTRGVQTSPDILPDLYIDLKRDFNQVSVFYEELGEKYEKAKQKFSEAKAALEEQKAREARLPVMYRDAYVTLLEEHRQLEKKYYAMKEQLRQLIDY